MTKMYFKFYFLRLVLDKMCFYEPCKTGDVYNLNVGKALLHVDCYVFLNQCCALDSLHLKPFYFGHQHLNDEVCIVKDVSFILNVMY